jgi:hypothetical protein
VKISKRKKADYWVNSDLLRMAEDLDGQAKGIGDEEDPEDRIRPNIHEASAYLRLAYATLARIPAPKAT